MIYFNIFTNINLKLYVTILQCAVGYAGDPWSECGLDSDTDGFPDVALSCNLPSCKGDNCPVLPNSGQEDCDDDGQGNSCSNSGPQACPVS